MKKALFALVCFWLVFQTLDWFFWQENLQEELEETHSLLIEKGWSAKQIAKAVVKEDIFPNKRAFLKAVESKGWLESLKPGTYLFGEGTSRSEVLQALNQGATQERITIPEGWTAQEIDAELARLAYAEQGQLLACLKTCLLQKFEKETPQLQKESLEGFLAPNTYFLDKGTFSMQDFVQNLLNEHQKWRRDIGLSDQEADEIVIIASLVEKEALLEKDFPLISGIIHKRLEEDWTLGIDATLLYEDADGRLSSADLKKDTPYNTRLHKGLPPSAIANAGKQSLEAALKPKKSDYWFYINRQDTGEAVYAITYEEHNANIDRYLR